MKNKYKLIKIVIFINFISCQIAAGSYPYAEVYQLDASEEELITAVERFKNDNQNYCVPVEVGLVDGRENKKSDHWYHIWFYYKDTNQIIYTWVRGSKFAFISVNQGLELGHWKQIHKDFSCIENKQEKEKFEYLILDNIKKHIK